jgi:precorrin-4/cobalt-precorrin-4 C11-methyltransferase
MHPVSFVGAGPGATDLLTLRAAERLRSADVLVWTDSLVCPGIPKLAPDGCEKIRTSTMTLEEVIPLLIERQKKWETDRPPSRRRYSPLQRDQ